MSKTREQVQRWMEQNRMVPREGRVIAALSGGADSMAMVHLLLSLFPRERILCAHVNHGIRGAEADEDEAFVRNWCSEQGLNCGFCRSMFRKRRSVPGKGWKPAVGGFGTSFWKVCFLGTTTGLPRPTPRSDQAETVLLHCCKEPVPGDCRGLRPVRGNIIRPVLLLSREEIEAYCRENGIPWRTDSTNACLDYTRNRLRHQVLPLLCSIQPETERCWLEQQKPCAGTRNVWTIWQRSCFLVRKGREAGRFPTFGKHRKRFRFGLSTIAFDRQGVPARKPFIWNRRWNVFAAAGEGWIFPEMWS